MATIELQTTAELAESRRKMQAKRRMKNRIALALSMATMAFGLLPARALASPPPAVFGGGVISVNSARLIPSKPRVIVAIRIQISQNKPNAMVAIDSARDPDGDDNPRFRRYESGAVHRNDAAAEYGGRWTG